MISNEAETRAELIDPKLASAGWAINNDCKIYREFQIAAPRVGCRGAKGLSADYILAYKNVKLAVVEAKKSSLNVGEGIAQAKLYANKLSIRYALSTNGKDIYMVDMQTGKESPIDSFPTPEELYNNTFAEANKWRDIFNNVPFEIGVRTPRYYQEIAVNRALDAVANNKDRILLTLATGTGKTFIAFQIAWKLFKSRWNLKKDGARLPRILFLADRNILANQAFNDFSGFPEDALVRIKPSEISKKGKVPTNGSIFFTIFQTFMSGPENTPNFGQYPKDYFDFIIIDECHRGGANDEGNWRGILEYFSPAIQLGLTATPKRDQNADTYRYFGDPVYIYSLKEGINDGYLTPFKVRRHQTTLDTYIYTSDDQIVEGEVEEGREYVETDFNRIIEIKEREQKRVKIFMDEINQKEKTIVFCATQEHAAAVRDLINQIKTDPNPDYCARVTANDGAIGEQYLAAFQNNDKDIPTILTTSQKLSTGVDARNVRNIVLMRPVNSMIEFKQIIGRGTRLFDGKEYFTIHDFVNAYQNFLDPEWDGEPVEPVQKEASNKAASVERDPADKADKDSISEKTKKLKIKLSDGKERTIQSMSSTSFWDASGKPVSAEEFLKGLYGTLPQFFKNEDELRKIWARPDTRKKLLNSLSNAGYGKDVLTTLQKMIDAEKSDLFDVLGYIAFSIAPITREVRVAQAQDKIFHNAVDTQKAFLEFVLFKYIETGVEELDQEKLPDLIKLKYKTIDDAEEQLGDINSIRKTFVEFQARLY